MERRRPAAGGLYVAGCLLLVVAGAVKLRRPASASSAASAVGIGLPGWAVRLGGAAEVVLGGTALAAGGIAAPLAVAAAYSGFAVVVIASLRRSDGVAGCGCFGETGAPVHSVQAVVDLAVAAAAIAVARGGGMAPAPVDRVAMVALGAAVAWVAYLAIVPLPRLMAAVREAGR